MLICQLTDLHLRPAGADASVAIETNLLTERAFRAVAALDPGPDAVILTGDLTECGHPDAYRMLATLLRRHLRLPVYVIPGNHDDRAVMRQMLAAMPGVTSGESYVQYAVDDYPVRLVMLDTLVPGHPHGELGADRLAFLDRTLAMQPDRPTLIAMHHPPFISGIEHMDKMNLRDSAAFGAVIERHRQVERIICGHNHRPATARVAQAVVSVGPSIAPAVELDLRPGSLGAIVREPAAFLLHWWTAKTGIVSHTAYVDDFPGPFPFASAAC